MVFRPVHAPRLCETIASRLRELVFEGSLAPGVRLPPERELAERFGASRPTIRDALSILETEGLLQGRRDGLYVADPVGETIAAPLTALFQDNPDSFADYLEFRLIIEREACYYAALRANDVDRDNIRRCFERVTTLHEKPDPEAEAVAEADFHLSIYEACHNLTILHVMRGMSGLLRQDVTLNRTRLYPRAGYRDLTVQQHRAIFEAIMNGAPDAAREAGHAHIAFARDALEEIKLADHRLDVSLRRMAARTPGGFPVDPVGTALK